MEYTWLCKLVLLKQKGNPASYKLIHIQLLVPYFSGVQCRPTELYILYLAGVSFFILPDLVGL